jgi:hypothetical protein
MDRVRRSRFQPVLRILRQSFSGENGVGRAFWQRGLLDALLVHPFTPQRLRGACALVRSYQVVEDYVMAASDLDEAWHRSLTVLTATHDLLAWAAELNLILSRSGTPES